jgi:hypothetical protein
MKKFTFLHRRSHLSVDGRSGGWFADHYRAFTFHHGLVSIWRRPLIRRLSVVLFFALTLWLSWNPMPKRTASQRVATTYAQLPLSFEVNQGQADAQVKFVTRGGGYSLLLTERGEPVLVLHGQARRPGQQPAKRDPRGAAKREPLGNAQVTVLRLAMPGSNATPAVEGEQLLPGRSNYLIGNDPQKWRRNVPHYSRVRYREVYPGVDLLYYGRNQQLEYDFIVKPGADPRAIRMTVKGAQKLIVGREGNLVVQTGQGRVLLHKPVAFQGDHADMRMVECSYELQENGEFRFVIGAYDASRPLRIDPVLSYSARIDAYIFALAVDSSGNSYLTGLTYSSNFPTTPGAFQSAPGGNGDVLVAKLDPSGSSLVYATYLGGSDSEWANAIAIDASGNVYVTGHTASTDFPTKNPFQTALAGSSSDAFLAKLDATGAQLLYSTYVGGQNHDQALGLSVDAAGNAYLSGEAYSSDFPTTTGAFQTVFAGGPSDAIVAKLDTTKSGAASLVYSTYLGGSGSDYAYGIAVDAAGNAYVTGATNSANFPIAIPIQGTCGSCPSSNDAFVTKLNASGSGLLYSTFLGGSGPDFGGGVAVDSSGNTYVVGSTQSANFPITVGAFQTTLHGIQDAFVTKINASGSALVYSSFLGGSDWDTAYAIALDAIGNVYLAGATYSTDFPTVNPVQAVPGGGSCGYYYYYPYTYPCADAMVPQLNAAGSGLVFSTYLGGSNADDWGMAIAVDSAGNAYVAGTANSSSFPFTPGALQMQGVGGFAAKISPVAAPGISFDTQSLSFAPQATGTTSNARDILLNNTGSVQVNISSISSSGDFAQTNNCGQNVSGGGNCTIQVTFTPSTMGAHAGTLSIASDAAGSPHNIVLSGTGASNAVVSLVPDPLFFGNVTVGSTSPAQKATLFNTGSGPMAISQISVTGNFAQTNTCSATLAAGAFCDIYVTFSPLTTGDLFGQLSIAHDGPSSPNAIGMNGRGVSTSTITLTSSSNPSNSGQSVTFTATVTPSSAAGAVIFMDGSITLGTGALNSGAATFSTPSLTNGSHLITAVYSGDSNFASSTSAPLTQVVNAPSIPGPSSTALASSPNPSSAGQAITFTATVTPSSATGTVTFMEGSTTLGSATLSGGVATVSTSSLASGSHSITAAYAGNSSFAASTSAAITQAVQAASAITLTSSPNPSGVGQSVTFTATVTPASATGTVQFQEGSNTLGSGTLTSGVATFSTSSLSFGNRTITAAYAGDSSFAASVSAPLTQTVNRGTSTTSLSSSPNPSTNGQFVVFTATVAPSGATGTVTFMEGSTTLGTSGLNAGASAFSTSSLAYGSHTVTAVYSGDTVFVGSTSAALAHTVKSPSSIVLSMSPNPSNTTQAVTFTATVTPASASGTVAFKEGSTTLGTGTLNIGTATYTTSSLTGGIHSVVAAYGGDSNFVPSTSAAQTQAVNSISFSASGTSATVSPGGTANFTLTVGQTGMLGAPISFSCTGLPLGGSCTFNPNTVPAGSGPTAVSVAINVGNSFAAMPPFVPAPYNRNRDFFVFASLALMAMSAFAASRKRSVRPLRTAVTLGLALVLLVISGCGGSSNPPPPPKTVAVTVNAISGSTTTSTVFTITVK